MVEFKRILCPVDLSELSRRPLVYAGAFAKLYSAHLTVLHVVPTFDPVEVRAGALFDPVSLVYPVPREAVLDQLRQTTADAGVQDVGLTFAAEAGEVAPTIADQSIATHADLLVMGTHGRSGFDRFLLGSVTEKVLRKASCPVLTVPPHAPESPPSDLAARGILCPVDFSPASLQALGFALELARRADAPVTVLHVIEWMAEEEPRELVHFNVPEFRQELIEQAREQLDALVSSEPRVTRGTSTVVAVGRAYREILRAETEKAAGLVVMGAQGRGGPGLTLFGSTTEQVVRGASCPVLTVRKPVYEG